MYALLDAARIGREVDTLKGIQPNHVCLYRGISEVSLTNYAPYLFEFIAESDLANFYFERGWGNSWGVFIGVDEVIEDLFRHLRKFLIVRTENKQELYFRFYDPRVLRIFLPTCDRQQLAEFFGPIHFFFMEDEDPNFALKFSLKDGELLTERIKQNLPVTDK